MSQSNQSTPVGNVSTYTFRDDGGTAMEVLLIPITLSQLGLENGYPPPELGADVFSNWVRGGYFFMNGECIAQLPRNADDLPLDQNASQVTDVLYRDGCIDVYYPVNREKTVKIVWNIMKDDWHAEYTDCNLEDGTLSQEGLAEDAAPVWNINPDKYTE